MIDTICKKTNQIVFDDDDSGEAADIVEISEIGDEIVIGLYHCKFSGGATPAQRVKDLYEVCGQAVRSMKWTTDTRRLLTAVAVLEILSVSTDQLASTAAFVQAYPENIEQETAEILLWIKRIVRNSIRRSFSV